MTNTKIVFLCASLEPGCDGVGDYVRRLSGELIRMNYQIAALALKDRYITDVVEEIQDADGTPLLVTRLPSLWSSSKRFGKAKHFVQNLNPQWLSLQYVPFGFQEKGIPFGLSRRILTLGESRKWHVMFHELWVGMHINKWNKLYWWGSLQKYLLMTLIQAIQPTVIHTQSTIYLSQLRKKGVSCKLLPIFSNIPVHYHSSTLMADESSEIRMILFGGIHPNAPIDMFGAEVAAYILENKTNIVLTVIGRNGSELSNWVSSWKSNGLTVKILNEQTVENISMHLQQSSIGISSTPIQLAEKSGSVAAMSAHGLPILFVAQPWQAYNCDLLPTPIGFIEYSPGNLMECIKFCQKNKPTANSVSTIAKQFINDLLYAKN